MQKVDLSVLKHISGGRGGRSGRRTALTASRMLGNGRDSSSSQSKAASAPVSKEK